jgi:predicted metal-dependent peptidase
MNKDLSMMSPLIEGVFSEKLHEKFLYAVRNLLLRSFTSDTQASKEDQDLYFYGNFLTNVNIKQSRSNPTMWVFVDINGLQLRYNPDFVDFLNQEQIVFTLIHECQHLLSKHTDRIYNRDAELSNVVTDCIINSDIISRKYKRCEPPIVLTTSEEFKSRYVEYLKSKNVDERELFLQVPEEYAGTLMYEIMYDWAKEQNKQINPPMQCQSKSEDDDTDEKSECSGDSCGNSTDGKSQSNSNNGNGDGNSQPTEEDVDGGENPTQEKPELSKEEIERRKEEKRFQNFKDKIDKWDENKSHKYNTMKDHLKSIQEKKDMESKWDSMDETEKLDYIKDRLANGDFSSTPSDGSMNKVDSGLADMFIENILQRMRNRGAISSDMEAFLSKIRPSKIDYLKPIKKTISNLGGIEKVNTYTRLNRRDLKGVKGFKRETMGVNVILDVSGSMDGLHEKVLGYCFQNNLVLNLLQVDADVQKINGKEVTVINTPQELQRMKIQGFGGTILQPGIDFFANDSKYKKFNTLILTDGWCDELDVSNLKKVVLISVGAEIKVNSNRMNFINYTIPAEERI